MLLMSVSRFNLSEPDIVLKIVVKSIFGQPGVRIVKCILILRH